MMRSALYVYTRRAFSSTPWRWRQFTSLQSLQDCITTDITSGSLDERKLLDDFKDIFAYAEKSSFTELSDLQRLSRNLLESQRSLEQATVKNIMLLHPPSTLIAPLLESFSAISPGPIPKSIADIAVRRCLWEADIQNAVKVVDLTTASPRCLKAMTQKRNSTVLSAFTGVIGVGGLMHYGISLLELPSTAGIFAMVATYALNIGFFGYAAFGGKFVGSVKNIQWKNGVPMSHRYVHADELTLLSKIAEADMKINGHEGYVSPGFKTEMDKRGIEIILPETELMLEEYWLTGGENFEWVEPDQDPADIIWRQNVATKKPNLLKDDIKWTDKFIQGGADQQTPTDQQGTAPSKAY